METPPLLDVLAQARADAAALKRHGDTRIAGALETLAEQVERTPELALLAWVSESDAIMRTGKSQRWFRPLRAGWEVRGLARRTPKGWQYRVCALPEIVRAERPADSDVEAMLAGRRIAS